MGKHDKLNHACRNPKSLEGLETTVKSGCAHHGKYEQNCAYGPKSYQETELKTLPGDTQDPEAGCWIAWSSERQDEKKCSDEQKNPSQMNKNEGERNSGQKN